MRQVRQAWVLQVLQPGEASVFEQTWYQPPLPDDADALRERWQRLRTLRSEVLKQIEPLRVSGKVGSSLAAEVALHAEGDEAASARGPGHQSIVQDDDGELWLAYHAWDEEAVGYGNFGKRSVWIDHLSLADGKATVDGPTGDPQPVP